MLKYRVDSMFRLRLTPASAAPPQAASGGGAKPRNELEAFVMRTLAVTIELILKQMEYFYTCHSTEVHNQLINHHFPFHKQSIDL